MPKELFGVLSIVLVVATYVPFIYQISKNHVRPHPFSWITWSITAASIASLQLLNGAGWGALPSATVTFFAITVAILAFKKNRAPIQKIDLLCLLIAFSGLASWVIIDQPFISITLLLLVDVVGFIPTLRKAWRVPYEDSLTMWGTTLSRHTASIFAIQTYNYVTLLNPLTWMVLSSVICSTLVLRRQSFSKRKGRKRIFRPHA